MVARFLITTADERTWKFDRPVLFLNEWCRLYDRKSVWEGMDAVVSDPYELKSEQQKKNIAYIQELTGQLLIELSAALNLHHNTNHTLRYWNILLGHWLERFVCTLFDRYYSLDHALRNHDVDATMVLKAPEYSLATSDSLSAIWASNDDTWNHVLCARILSFLGGLEIKSKPVEAEMGPGFDLYSDAIPRRESWIRFLTRIITKNITPIFTKQDDAFITSTYLPKWREVGLQLALRQFPQFWQSPPLMTATLNRAMRQSLSVGDDSQTGFERFLRLQLADMIPICYLEGYDQLCYEVTKLPWPSSPKFIYTANRFDTDEIFKAWVGLKVEQGFPYFVGQHGANYGTFYTSEKFTVASTCDRFFTWGWTNNNSKNIPAFICKNIGKSKKVNLKDGDLLLSELPPLHHTGLSDINAAYSDFSKYQDEQFQFVAALPKAIQKKLTVRLHGEWKKHRWSDENRWNDRYPDIRIDEGSISIGKLISRSRLVVHSYDSTGLLETLALNKPTMCFWYGGLDHLLPIARPYYEKLKEVGILADSPEQAARNVASCWNDIGGWWANEKVQSARREFCEQYARMEKTPIKKLKNILTTQSLSFNVKKIII